MRLTSVLEKPKVSYPRTLVYSAQCLFLGEESFRNFAERIKAARNIRCTVHLNPFATGGSFCFNLSRYTNVVMSVGT